MTAMPRVPGAWPRPNLRPLPSSAPCSATEACADMAARQWSPDAPVRSDYLVFGQPQLLDVDIDEVVATLRSNWIGTGPRVAAFEDAFRDYVDSPHAVAVN